MADAGRSELVNDFLAAAVYVRMGTSATAMVTLCPLGLTETQLAQRIDRLIVVGRAVVGAADPAAERLVPARGQGRLLVDELVDLVDLIAQHGSDG